jgi:hypothetical protein
LTAAKGECYPHKEAIVIPESAAEVNLQGVVGHSFASAKGPRKCYCYHFRERMPQNPHAFQLILPAEAEQESTEEPSSTSSDDYSSGTKDDY